MGVLLLANASANAGDIKVSNVEVQGDPMNGFVDVEFDLNYTADGAGDIVFLAVQAGQDQLVPISAEVSLGNFSGHVKRKLHTSRSVAALTNPPTRSTSAVQQRVAHRDNEDRGTYKETEWQRKRRRLA